LVKTVGLPETITPPLTASPCRAMGFEFPFNRIWVPVRLIMLELFILIFAPAEKQYLFRGDHFFVVEIMSTSKPNRAFKKKVYLTKMNELVLEEKEGSYSE
jgi:hypothetical protein